MANGKETSEKLLNGIVIAIITTLAVGYCVAVLLFQINGEAALVVFFAIWLVGGNILLRKFTSLKCPECNGRLLRIIENPLIFPKRCRHCGADLP